MQRFLRDVGAPGRIRTFDLALLDHELRERSAKLTVRVLKHLGPAPRGSGADLVAYAEALPPTRPSAIAPPHLVFEKGDKRLPMGLASHKIGEPGHTAVRESP